MTRDVLHIIQEKMTSFSKGQKRIAGYILSDYDKAAFMTANKLGTVVGVSESTVVRFAAELGYEGYPSMQKALQEIVRSKLTSIQRIRASNDRLFGSDVVTTVLQADMDKIRSAIESVDRSAFENVVDKLMEARHIYILGVRSSSFLAGYLHFYFHLIFENVTLVTSNSAGDILESILRIGPGDVLVGISFPRYSSEDKICARMAREAGAKIIVVTDKPSALLAEYATVLFTVPVDSNAFFNCMVGPQFVAEAILETLSHKAKGIEKRLKKIDRYLGELGNY